MELEQLERHIKTFLKYDMISTGWKSPLYNDEYWNKVDKDAKRLAKSIYESNQ
jgi:hypothetical protein